MYNSYADVLESYTIAEEGILSKVKDAGKFIWKKLKELLQKLKDFLNFIKNKCAKLLNITSEDDEDYYAVKYTKEIGKELDKIMRINILSAEKIIENNDLLQNTFEKLDIIRVGAISRKIKFSKKAIKLNAANLQKLSKIIMSIEKSISTLEALSEKNPDNNQIYTKAAGILEKIEKQAYKILIDMNNFLVDSEKTEDGEKFISRRIL